MGVERGVVSNTTPNRSGNPEQSLRPVLASSGRDDSGGVSQVLSPEARAGFLQATQFESQRLQQEEIVQLLDPGQAGGGPAGSHVLVSGANVSGLGSSDRARGSAAPAFSTSELLGRGQMGARSTLNLEKFKLWTQIRNNPGSEEALRALQVQQMRERLLHVGKSSSPKGAEFSV